MSWSLWSWSWPEPRTSSLAIHRILYRQWLEQRRHMHPCNCHCSDSSSLSPNCNYKPRTAERMSSSLSRMSGSMECRGVSDRLGRCLGLRSEDSYNHTRTGMSSFPVPMNSTLPYISTSTAGCLVSSGTSGNNRHSPATQLRRPNSRPVSAAHSRSIHPCNSSAPYPTDTNCCPHRTPQTYIHHSRNSSHHMPTDKYLRSCNSPGDPVANHSNSHPPRTRNHESETIHCWHTPTRNTHHQCMPRPGLAGMMSSVESWWSLSSTRPERIRMSPHLGMCPHRSCTIPAPAHMSNNSDLCCNCPTLQPNSRHPSRSQCR